MAVAWLHWSALQLQSQKRQNSENIVADVVVASLSSSSLERPEQE